LFYKETDILKETSTNTIRLRLLKNNIIHYTYISDTEIDLENVIINHNVFKDFAPFKPALIIDSVDGLVQIEAAGVKFIRDKEKETPLIGRAFVTNSMANKILISIYYKTNPSLFPVKVFKDYIKAHEWLSSLTKNEK
jgi:hypothetical protein